MHKNGNNANIGIRGFILWKQKNFSYFDSLESFRAVNQPSSFP